MKRFCHMGAGPIILRDPKCEWVNVDIEPTHNPDLCFDYTDPAILGLLERKSFAGLLSIHSLEHVSPFPEAVDAALSNFYQLLQPGGILRLVLPDLMTVAQKYVRGETLKDVFDGPFHEGPDMPSTRFTFFTRAWSHTWLPDEQIVRYFLARAGFREIKVMPFHISDRPEMCGHDRFLTESQAYEAKR